MADLRESLRDQAGADDHIMAMVDSKAKEWAVHFTELPSLCVCVCSSVPLSPQSVLSAKQTEISECRRRIANLEDQLRVVQRDTDKASIVKLKKVTDTIIPGYLHVHRTLTHSKSRRGMMRLQSYSLNSQRLWRASRSFHLSWTKPGRWPTPSWSVQTHVSELMAVIHAVS